MYCNYLFLIHNSLHVPWVFLQHWWSCHFHSSQNRNTCTSNCLASDRPEVKEGVYTKSIKTSSDLWGFGENLWWKKDLLDLFCSVQTMGLKAHQIASASMPGCHICCIGCWDMLGVAWFFVMCWCCQARDLELDQISEHYVWCNHNDILISYCNYWVYHNAAPWTLIFSQEFDDVLMSSPDCNLKWCLVPWIWWDFSV